MWCAASGCGIVLARYGERRFGSRPLKPCKNRRIARAGRAKRQQFGRREMNWRKGEESAQPGIFAFLSGGARGRPRVYAEPGDVCSARPSAAVGGNSGKRDADPDHARGGRLGAGRRRERYRQLDHATWIRSRFEHVVCAMRRLGPNAERLERLDRVIVCLAGPKRPRGFRAGPGADDPRNQARYRAFPQLGGDRSGAGGQWVAFMRRDS